MADWFEQIPATVTVEHNGQQVPLRDHPFIKESKDLPSFTQKALDAHRELGGRIRIPGKDAKPEERTAFLAKVSEAGLIESAPASFDKYEISRPEKLAENLWSEELAGNFKKFAHGIGLTNKQAQELVKFHAQSIEQATTAEHLSTEEATKALKAELGDKYQATVDLAGRVMEKLFPGDNKTKAFLDRTGLGNDPELVKFFAKLGALNTEDQTLLGTGAQPGIESNYQQALDIQSGKDKEKYAEWVKERADGKWHKFIADAYAKKFPGKHAETVGVKE